MIHNGKPQKGFPLNGAKNYDAERTKALVKVLHDAGGTVIFNDRKSGADQHAPGHNNHLHVCFDPKESKVKNACQKL